MRKIVRFVCLSAFACATFMPAVQSQATMTLVGLVPVDNSAAPSLAGYRTYDLVVNTTSDWTAAAMLLELTQGDIFQHVNGDANGLPPIEVVISILGDESLRYDTFVTNPDGTDLGSGVGIAGGAGDVGGNGFTFSTTELDVTWFSPGSDTNDIGDSKIARITLSNDAQGTLLLAITEAGTPNLERFEITIVPEPATLGLFSLAGLAMLRRRR